MMELIAGLQSSQDANTVRDRRLLAHDLLKAPLEGRVLFDVLPVLVQGCRSHATKLTTGKQRLQKVASIHRTARCPSADNGMNLVDEGDHLPFRCLNLGEDSLQALLELTAVLCTCNHGSNVERDHCLVLQSLRNIALNDAPSKPFHDSSLTYSGLANDDGIVFGATGKDLDYPTDLIVTSNHRVKLTLSRHLGEVCTIRL
mmetsp:Transcript_53059/g.114749  ORF Transcript_53059/g.114749 Transcript_53059/m.114749 type:complete len:201 (-) Transcript_53059:838-1440(-)